jgi:oxygen-dependent protoporphyrinogen oxidase
VNQDDAGLIRLRIGIRNTMGLDRTDVTFVKRWDRGIPELRTGPHCERGRALRTARDHPAVLNCNAYRGIAMNDCARHSRELAGRIAV